MKTNTLSDNDTVNLRLKEAKKSAEYLIQSLSTSEFKTYSCCVPESSQKELLENNKTLDFNFLCKKIQGRTHSEILKSASKDLFVIAKDQEILYLLLNYRQHAHRVVGIANHDRNKNPDFFSYCPTEQAYLLLYAKKYQTGSLILIEDLFNTVLPILTTDNKDKLPSNKIKLSDKIAQALKTFISETCEHNRQLEKEHDKTLPKLSFKTSRNDANNEATFRLDNALNYVKNRYQSSKNNNKFIRLHNLLYEQRSNPSAINDPNVRKKILTIAAEHRDKGIFAAIKCTFWRKPASYQVLQKILEAPEAANQPMLPTVRNKTYK